MVQLCSGAHVFGFRCFDNAISPDVPAVEREFRKVNEQRAELVELQAQQASELVELKTRLELYRTMSDAKKSSLMRFLQLVQRIGKGNGVRAARHKRDAARQMQHCFSALPAWVMPTWRVSELMPSELSLFDLVVLDESSQSDIASLPALLRGKQILVVSHTLLLPGPYPHDSDAFQVGDDQQVSPCESFVKEEVHALLIYTRCLRYRNITQVLEQLRCSHLVEQHYDELLLPGRSIFDLACAMFPSQRGARL